MEQDSSKPIKNRIAKKIIPALFIIVALFLVFYSYKIVRNRYFQNETKIENENNQSNENSAEKLENIQIENSEDTQVEKIENKTEETQETTDPELEKLTKEEDAEEEKSTDAIDEEYSFANVTSKDCQNSCEKYKDKDELGYCQEFCGLSTKKEDTSDCADLEGLDIDYCFKDLAISKKDYSICDKIQDSGIQKTCRNRITEDIIDSQK